MYDKILLHICHQLVFGGDKIVFLGDRFDCNSLREIVIGEQVHQRVLHSTDE